jgi:hypothetical protein
VGSRSLTDVERTWIERLRARHLLWVLVGFACTPVAIGLGIALVSLPHKMGGAFEVVAMVYFMFAILLGIPVSILLVRDHLHMRRELAEDLREGLAWVFEPAAPFTHSLPNQQAAGFAMLPHTHRVVDVSSRSADTAGESLVEAALPEVSGMYAPMSLKAENTPPDLQVQQRHLTAAERSELDRVRRFLLVPRFSGIFGFLGLIGLGVYVVRVPHSAMKVGDVFSTVCMFLIFGLLIRQAIRGFVIAARIKTDLAAGIVALVSSPNEPAMEVLPFSNLVWRRQGAPAPWRDRDKGLDLLRRSL